MFRITLDIIDNIEKLIDNEKLNLLNHGGMDLMGTVKD